MALDTLLVLFGSAAQAQTSGPRFINSPGLTRPTGYTHVVASADGRTAYIAGYVVAIDFQRLSCAAINSARC